MVLAGIVIGLAIAGFVIFLLERYGKLKFTFKKEEEDAPTGGDSIGGEDEPNNGDDNASLEDE